MEGERLEYLFYRIDCAYQTMRHSKGNFIIKSPDKHIKYEANFVFLEELKEACFQDLFTPEEIVGFMFYHGLWDHDKETELLTLPEEIEDLKIEIYKNFHGKTTSLRRDLARKKNRLEVLNQEKHRYDHYTTTGYATYSKSHFILENTVYYRDVKYDFSEVSDYTFLSFINENMIAETEMRAIARSEPWSSVFEMRKNGILFSEETDDQKRLVIYNSMYNSIRESSNAPSEDIIADDDALDGWMIKQKRESQAEKERNFFESRTKNKKILSAQEVFMPASSIEEARKIERLNSSEAMINKNRRMSAADKKGSIGITDMPDIMDKVQMELNARLT